ncbi:MAG: pirin family protein [Candidatus Krumholzibacteriia bacterium]
MIKRRLAGERGHANHGWLETFYTFSFAGYRDGNHMGFRSLRVINDDTIQPGGGFGTHPHADMEIITYVLDGALEHKDSTGTGSVIGKGDVQYMSAGTGITHSEFNGSDEHPLHLLQIWILPAGKGQAPAYEQKAFPASLKRGRLCAIATPDGRDGSLVMRQDASLYAAVLTGGEGVSYAPGAGRHAWVQVARGAIRLNGQDLAQGDGAAVRDEPRLELEGAGEEAEVLLFDLA